MTQALTLYASAETGAGQTGSRKRWRTAAQALALLTDDATGQRAFVTASASHKRADWRAAARALAEALQGRLAEASPPPTATRREKSLLEYLASRGGIADDGGELAQMGADCWHRGRAFRPMLVKPTGRTLEDAAQDAWESGYFPNVAPPAMNSAHVMHAVTPAMLLDAIERELGGRLVLPYDHAAGVPSAHDPVLGTVALASDWEARWGEAEASDDWMACPAYLASLEADVAQYAEAA